MAKRNPRPVEDTHELAAKPEPPRSLAVAARGIYSAQDAARFTVALIYDTLDHRIDTRVANAVNSQTRTLLRISELQERFAARHGQKPDPTLILVEPEQVT